MMVYGITEKGRVALKIVSDTCDVIVDAPIETLYEWISYNCDRSIRFERVLPDCTDIEQTYRTVSAPEYADNYISDDDWKQFAKWVHENMI